MSIEQFQKNLAGIRERIHQAEIRSGRAPGCVRLVGVTKYVDAVTARQLVAAGCLELGENRPQELWDKAAELNDPRIVWHLIGHLQRNKVKRTIEVASLIHSVDSDRLMQSIDVAAAEINRKVDVLLEVNVSGDTAKHGFIPVDLPLVLEKVERFSHLVVKGLMGMAGLDSDADATRREFIQLRELRDSLGSNLPCNAQLHELSMGMSGDFETAIEEGATIIRVGSLLFHR